MATVFEDYGATIEANGNGTVHVSNQRQDEKSIKISTDVDTFTKIADRAEEIQGHEGIEAQEGGIMIVVDEATPAEIRHMRNGDKLFQYVTDAHTVVMLSKPLSPGEVAIHPRDLQAVAEELNA